ncbi:MAG: hypothetical protein JWR80_7986 [Bradyrhizobium sp.]|nr:hypothetical protein [Bradyrhizobium sp.]
MREAPTIILAVAPFPDLAKAALEARGLDPVAAGPGLRMVTRAPALRGWSPGTPVVANSINYWGLSGPSGAQLAICLLSMLRTGKLRLLQDEDIARLKADAA